MESPVVWITAAVVLTTLVWIVALAALLNSFRFSRSKRRSPEPESSIKNGARDHAKWVELGALILPSLIELQLARWSRNGQEVSMAEKRSSTFPYFLVGATLGAVAGVLFAPKKGSETRKKVRAWIEEETELGKELLEKGQVAGRDLLERGQERLAETKEQIVDAVKSRGNTLRNGKKAAAKK